MQNVLYAMDNQNHSEESDCSSAESEDFEELV